MPKLLLMKDKEAVSSFDLAEGNLVIGRGADCDIQLDDESISRRHIQVFTLMGDAFLEDLGSRNGTYVNGKLSQKCALSDGDVIQIGQQELVLSHPQEAERPQRGTGEVEATQIIRPGDFGPATLEAQEKNRVREGISPVTIAAREDQRSAMRTEPGGGNRKSGGFWSWLRGLFS